MGQLWTEVSMQSEESTDLARWNMQVVSWNDIQPDEQVRRCVEEYDQFSPPPAHFGCCDVHLDDGNW